MASNYVLNQKISAALAKSAEALAVAQSGGGGGGGGGAPETLAETLQTSGTITSGPLNGQSAGAGNAFNQPITNGGEIESTNHQIIKASPILGGNGTALADITFDSANGDNLLIRTVGTRNIQIGATSGTDKISIGKVPDSAGSKMQVEGTVESTGFSVKDSGNTSHSVASYDNTDNLVQLSSASDPVRILAPSSAVYDFTGSEMKSTEKVRFDNSGLHSSTTLASRQNGDRVVLYSPANGTNDQYTMGIEGGSTRMSSGQSFKFYYRPSDYLTNLAVGESEAFRIEAMMNGTNLSLRPFTTQGDLKVLDSTATTTSLHVDTANRRVGINKANPTEDLDVDGNIQINTSGTGRLIFYDSNGSHEHAELDGTDDGTNGGKLVLKTKTDGGAVEARITVDGVGAIGIGPTPNYGTSGQVLTSQGPATTPIWATPSGGGGGTTVYGGTWFPNIYTFYYVPAGQLMYAHYHTPGDTVNNPWYSSTYNGDSHGRYAVTVFPGTPNRYKVDLWFKLYCGGSGSTANDIYKWGYNLQANPSSVNGAIRHGGFGNGINAEVTFDANGNINGGKLTLECGFDVSDFMTKINTAVGTNLTFDTTLVPGISPVNLGNSVFYEHVVGPTGVIRPLTQSVDGNIYFNENGWARGFDPTDPDPQDANIPAGSGNPLTSLGWSGNTNANPQVVPFGKSPNDIFSMNTAASGAGTEFYAVNNASNRGSIRQFGGTLSYWMVEA
jgi:hypothetical protein